MFVCCLPTQNFEAGLVGRNIFGGVSIQEKGSILKANLIDANKLYIKKRPKKILGWG